jgi:hypothetical protein
MIILYRYSQPCLHALQDDDNSYPFFNLLYLFAVTKPTIEIANKKMDAKRVSIITINLASLLI